MLRPGGKGGAEIDRGGGFADAALLIDDCENASRTAWGRVGLVWDLGHGPARFLIWVSLRIVALPSVRLAIFVT